MKKLLGLLSTLTLTASISTSVIACGSNKDDDGDSDEDKEAQTQYRNEFIAEVTQLIKNHIEGNKSRMYVENSLSKDNLFLNYDNLAEIITDKTGEDQEIVLNDTQLSNFKKDVDGLLALSVTLKDNIEKIIRERNDYQFLLTNIDQIFEGFKIDNKVTFSAQEHEVEGEESEYVFTVNFKLSPSFVYVWNGEKETEELAWIDLKYLGLTQAFVDAGIMNVVNGIANQLFNNDTNGVFRFDEEKIKSSTSNTFGSQSNRVLTHFTDDTNKQTLTTAVNEAANALQTETPDAITLSFDNISTATTKRLYTGSLTHRIVTDGYFDMALFNKDAEATPQTMDDAFEKDFANTYSKAKFIENEKTNILNTFHVTLPTESEEQFVEYGQISLEGIKAKLFGLSIELNPISVLYVYNPKETFAQRNAKVFENWRTAWGVTTSNDRFALFKLSQTSEAGKAFWAGNPFWPFDITKSEANRNKYFSEDLKKDTGINSFWLTHHQNSRNPYASFDQNGLAVNFWGFQHDWTENSSAFDRSWVLVVRMDEVTITINFAHNKDYFSNIWVGSGKGNAQKKYIIEKGA